MKNIKTTIASITTPQQLRLYGLFFSRGPVDTVLIYIHGLGGSLFSKADFLKSLVDSRTAVLAFNNRGSGIISGFSRLNPRRPVGKEFVIYGLAHEVFTDCVDDIDGAVSWAKNAGAKNIYLVGHSTGCQKSVYYLAQRPKSLVKGAVLLAPVSDFADAFARTDRRAYNKALAYARKLLKAGRPQELMPTEIWPHIVDAQRWLSLFTPDSPEEIFSYASGRRPFTLLKNRKPVFVILAEHDEHGERPMTEIADWFQINLRGRKITIRIIKGASHDFSNNFAALRTMIKKWLAGQR